jgi:hypothetical protein
LMLTERVSAPACTRIRIVSSTLRSIGGREQARTTHH